MALNEICTDYEIVSLEHARKNFKNFTHAAHGMIFSWNDDLVFDLYKPKAAVLMQMRFDGILGFPGGLVDEGECPAEALNREMVEEINLDLSKHSFTDKYHLVTHIHHGNKMVLHFYAQEVTMEEFKKIELCCLSSKEYGIEVFGVVRPVLYTMEDGFKGLPAFLSNRFAGNARDQLLYALQAKKILSSEEIDNALKKLV